MDKRTIKIRDLQSKLLTARDFILRCGISAIQAPNENKVMSSKYWAEEALRKYSETRE